MTSFPIQWKRSIDRTISARRYECHVTKKLTLLDSFHSLKAPIELLRHQFHTRRGHHGHMIALHIVDLNRLLGELLPAEGWLQVLFLFFVGKVGQHVGGAYQENAARVQRRAIIPSGADVVLAGTQEVAEKTDIGVRGHNVTLLEFLKEVALSFDKAYFLAGILGRAESHPKVQGDPFAEGTDGLRGRLLAVNTFGVESERSRGVQENKCRNRVTGTRQLSRHLKSYWPACRPTSNNIRSLRLDRADGVQVKFRHLFDSSRRPGGIVEAGIL